MIAFEWTEMNDETFKLIKRDRTRTSVEVLAINGKGAILIGRIHKHEDPQYGYTLETYLGGGFNNVTKFVKASELTSDQD